MTNEMTLSFSAKQTVQALYAAIARGDTGAVAGAFSENVEIHESPVFPHAGTYRGLQGLLELFPHLSQYFELSSINLHYIVADGERVVTLFEVVTRANSQKVLVTEHIRLSEGRIVEVRVFRF